MKEPESIFYEKQVIVKERIEKGGRGKKQAPLPGLLFKHYVGMYEARS